MKVKLVWSAVSRGVAALLAVAAIAVGSPAQAADPISIEIVIAPNVISLHGAGVLLTVHADIPYNAVDAATVELRDDHGNSVGMDWCKADDRGDFVAKFVMDEVVDELELVPAVINNLTLRGWTADQIEFAGTDGVKVIERAGR